MASSDDDEDLKKAIAISLQEQTPRTIAQAYKESIDLDSDEEKQDEPLIMAAPSPPASSSLSFLGLDRKAMEAERLARKRRASISPPPPRKKVKETAVSATQPPAPRDFHTLHPPARPEPLYLNGIVKKTWALGHERKDDIKIEEVLQRNQLNLAVLSSFQWDVGWLLSKLNTRTTQLYFVMQAKDESTKRQYRQGTANMPNLRLCFPSMEGQVNCMHSKLMLLSYPSHLRIVVPTANLVPYDWGETGVMENMLFLIDLPRLPDSYQTPTVELPAFGKELIYFLQAMGLEETVVQSVHKFDFSKTKDIAFVHTIGGAHTDVVWRRTGYCGLGRAIQQLGLVKEGALNLDFVTSSVGSLNMDFLMSLYLAAQGDDGLTEYDWRNSKKWKAKASGTDKKARDSQDQVENDVKKGFRIYFPTRDTVVNSTGGAQNGGTICFQPKWYDSPTFPRQLLRDCKSQRKGLLMHNKVRVSWPLLCYQGSTLYKRLPHYRTSVSIRRAVESMF